jgi:hypothetical protein
MGRTRVDIRDLVLGAICLFLAGALVWMSRDLTAIPGQHYGADTLPKVVAGLSALIGLWMVVGGLRGGTDPAPHDDLPGEQAAALRDPHWAGKPSPWLRLAAAVGLVLAYMVLSPPFGFLPAALVMVLGLLLLMGVRPLTALLVAVPAVIAIRYAFGDLLLVPLPRSPFLGGW